MAVVFDSVGFSAALDSLKSKVSDKLKSELNTTVTEEAKSKLDDKSPNDAQAYTNFYNSVNPVDDFKKDIIPEDVYKAIMLEAAVRDKTISNGFNIGNLDGKTVSAVAGWFQGIFGKTTITVDIFNAKKNKTDKYTVTMTNNYSAQVTFPSGKTYSVTWENKLDEKAKTALTNYINALQKYLSNYRYQIYGEIIKDGLSSLINEFVAEVAEGVDSARENLINGFHEWALGKAADVAIDKILPTTYKQIKAVEKNYKAFVKKLDDLKAYAKNVSDGSIKTNKKYTDFVKAYNNLGIGNYVNVNVVDDYLSYEFLETVGGVFDQSKALITGTDSDNEISASGSYVTIKGGGGNDFISASGLNSRISGEAGNDKVLLKSSQGSISGGKGNDSIIVDGERNTVLGGPNDDYIALFKGKNTVTGGTGNDSIFFVGVGESVIKYNKGDGNDTIVGYEETDTIKIMDATKITDDYSTQTSGQDVIITVGNDSIRLVGASGKKININNKVEPIGKPGTGGEVTEYTLPSGFDTTDSGFDTTQYVKYGTNGNDYISNSSDKTMINTGAGNDSVYNHYSYECTIDGGAGNDYIKNAGANVTIDAGTGNDSISNYGKYAEIDGGLGNDSIYNDWGNYCTIDGGAGNDTIYSQKYYYNSSNNVTINGGEGNDLISMSSSGNLIQYKTSDGNDTVYGFTLTDTLSILGGGYVTGVGNDIIIKSGSGSIILKDARFEPLNIIFSDGSDTSGALHAEGSKKSEVINNPLSGSTINALGGNDTIKNFASKVTIDGCAGNDYIYNDNIGSLSTIDGGAGNDYIKNWASKVTIDGGAGNDFIDNSGGDSVTIDAGTGNDSIYNTGDSVTIDAGAGNDSIYNRSGDSLTIDGGAGNDSIYNYGGDSVTIDAGTGNDSIYNTGDSVTIDAGAGNDTIRSWGDNVTIDGGAGNDSIYHYGAFEGGNNVSIKGGSGNDSIYNYYGDSVTIDGGTDNDSIYNYCGDSVTIDGGTGNDSIYNYCGDSVTIDGGVGNDIVSLSSDSRYSKNTLIQYTLGDGNDSIYGFRADSTLSISGNSYSTTKSGSDIIVTVGDGKISLMGAASLDNVNIIRQVSTKTLTNKNSAKITIGTDIDVADASKRTKAIKIVGNTFDNTILGGAKNDSLYGGKGADSLVGNAGNDRLYGQAGNDTLVGGKGNDSLWGDAGKDTFIYSSGDGKDVIYGFDNKDTLTLDNLEFTGSYSKKNKTVTLKFDNGSVALKNFTATTFHIDNDVYKISGSKFKKQ